MKLIAGYNELLCILLEIVIRLNEAFIERGIVMIVNKI